MFKSIYRVKAFVEGEQCNFYYEVAAQNELKAVYIARKQLAECLGLERHLIKGELEEGAN